MGGGSGSSGASRATTLLRALRASRREPRQATGLLAKLISDRPDDGPRLRFELKELGRRRPITHDVIQHLNAKAATPFSVSDAHEPLGARRRRRPRRGSGGLHGALPNRGGHRTGHRARVRAGAGGGELAEALTRLRRPPDLRPYIVARPARTRGRPPRARRAQLAIRPRHRPHGRDPLEGHLTSAWRQPSTPAATPATRSKNLIVKNS